MRILAVSCSLNPNSRSASMIRHACEIMKTEGITFEFLNLSELELPMCDGGAAYGHPNVSVAAEAVAKADAIILGAAVYNFDLNAAAKNFLELTGKGWTEKVVSFICAAGGQGSYMSVMPFANSLMLDYRCFIIPRFVYAIGKSFDGNTLADDEIEARIRELVQTTADVTRKLKA